MSDEGQERQRIGLVWMVFCTLLGLSVLYVAVKGQEWWQWQGIWPSILTNAGTALLLAALLFILERRFTGRVIRANRRAVREAAAEVEENLQHRTEELAARIDELQTQVDQRMRAQAESQDAVVADLDAPSYKSVAAALVEANKLEAISNGHVTVQATSDPEGIGFTFKFGTYPDVGANGFRPGLRLEITAVLRHDVLKRGIGVPIIEEEWRPEDQFADVASRMNAQLQRAGYWTGPDTVDWSMVMRNLQRSLELSIASRRGDTLPWRLHGPLIQLIGSDWAITEAGIEARHNSSVIVDEAEFPEKPFGVRRDPDAAKWNPDYPDGPAPPEWPTLVRLGRGCFPRGRLGVYLGMPHWLPFTGEHVPD
ncbi:hypothetical protein OHS18_30885 [Amycolatopsis sp. NBC_00355]|uniref:hypothetical protein n=1 Tax=Amycolatopsis sp. NBC_00355 TaxID=2975957 RepID=UPI002E255131